MEGILGVEKKRDGATKTGDVMARVLNVQGDKKTKKRPREFERLQQELKADEVFFADTHFPLAVVSGKRQHWELRRFRQSSRSDDAHFRLRRWEKVSTVKAGDLEKEYFADKEVKLKYPVVQIAPEELSESRWRAIVSGSMDKKYQSFAATFTGKDVVELLRLLEATELNFIVVADRVNRPIEQIKFIYYTLVNIFDQGRKPASFDPDADVARRQAKDATSADQEKSRTLEVRRLNGLLKELKDITGQIDKALGTGGPTKAGKGGGSVAFFASEDPLDLPAGMGKKFPEAKQKLQPSSQRVKRLCFDLAAAQEQERQLKAVLKTVSAAATTAGSFSGAITPKEKTEE